MSVTNIGFIGKYKHSREINDFYATDPEAIIRLLQVHEIDKTLPVWECACGLGHLAKPLKEKGYKVLETDIVKRYENAKQLDFLTVKKIFKGNIVTNPPYKFAVEFIKKSMEILKTGNKAYFLLKLSFLESEKRKLFFKTYPPKYVYVSTKRIICCKNGEFDKYSNSAIAYAWFIFEKGYTGETILRWF